MNKTTKLTVITLALINVAVHLFFYNQLEYHRDELLYFSLGKHPDFGFATVPPLIGWLATLMEQTIGFSLFAVKLLPAILGGVFTYLVALISKELGGKSYAQILAAVCFMFTPIFMLAWSLFQPVPFDIFFWSLSFYWIIKYINTEQEKWLYWLGLTIGFALLNKYLFTLLLLSIILILPFTKHRNLFKNKAFYISIGIALLIFLPNIIWQWLHDFPVFNHLSELNETQLQQVNRFSFLVEQISMFYVGFIIAVFGLIYLFINKQKNYVIIGLATIIVFVSLLILRGKSYYTAGIYPVLIASGAAMIELLTKTRVLKVAILLVIIVFTIPLLPYGLPIYNPTKLVDYFDTMESIGIDVGRNYDDGTKHELPQDYADMQGWEELTLLVKNAYDKANHKEAVLIFCENYGLAGAVSVIGEKYGLPDPLSFAESFIYWIPNEFKPDIQSFIYVNDNLGGDIQELFSEITEIGRIENKLSREYQTQVYLCEKPNRPFNDFWKEVINELNNASR